MDAAGHVTLHFELQWRILEVQYSLYILYTLADMDDSMAASKLSFYDHISHRLVFISAS